MMVSTRLLLVALALFAVASVTAASAETKSVVSTTSSADVEETTTAQAVVNRRRRRRRRRNKPTTTTTTSKKQKKRRGRRGRRRPRRRRRGAKKTTTTVPTTTTTAEPEKKRRRRRRRRGNKVTTTVAATTTTEAADTTTAGRTTEAMTTGQVSTTPKQKLDKDAIGFAHVELYGVQTDTRQEETNFGNLIADAMLFEARELKPKVRFAFINSGAIARGISAGSISKAQVRKAIPGDHNVKVLRLTVQELVNVMESMISMIQPGLGFEPVNGLFPQIAGGAFAYDLSKDPGSRITTFRLNMINDPNHVIVSEGEIHGNPDRPVLVATTDYVYNMDFVDLPSRADLLMEDVGVTAYKAAVEYIKTMYPDVRNGFNRPEQIPTNDNRLQNIEQRQDNV